MSLDERVYLERVRIFFGLAKGNMAGIFLGTLLIGLVLHMGGAPVQSLAIWGALIAVSWFAVVRYEGRVAAVGINESNCNDLLRIRIILGASVAFLWGLAGYLLPGTGTQVQDTYIFIILSTLVTVGTLGYAAMPAYYLVLNFVSLVPLSIKFAYQLVTYEDNYYLLLLALTITWQAVVMKKARQVSLNAIEAIVINERLKDEIEEHKRTKAVLQQMAQQDPLTGLANRTLFSDRLNQTLVLAQRNKTRFAQLYLDLDRFKPVNDQHGHAVGDIVLKTVAARILGCVRDSDTVARVGGDEFVVLLRDIDAVEGAIHVAEKIRSSIDEVMNIEGKSIGIGCCVGVAIYPDHGRTELELSRAADAAMYQAKVSGKNAIRLATTLG